MFQGKQEIGTKVLRWTRVSIARSTSDVIIQSNKTECWKIEIFFKRLLASVYETTFKTKIWPSFSSHFSHKTLILSDSRRVPIIYIQFLRASLLHLEPATSIGLGMLPVKNWIKQILVWYDVMVLSAGNLPIPVPYNTAENKINIISNRTQVSTVYRLINPAGMLVEHEKNS